MILPSTVRKLAANGSTIYRTTFPRFTFQGVDHPEYSELFSTKQAANHASANRFIPGVSHRAVITEEICSIEEHYLT